ncbi:MAG: hypothetical protein HKN72_05295 [Gemmatimonadetes bacterium]|nr:hypothetical protein [Gemmatimonadota bacterium]NNL30709.1 hypothetical protein [Gemmatimonadota bacterium]
MRSILLGLTLSMVALTGCRDELIFVEEPGGAPAAPRAVAASYYAGSVTVTWELAPDWNGEAFRVYSRRTTDNEWFFIAEVTSCSQDFCTYEDINVVADESYEYLVSAVDDDGTETDAATTVVVFVPQWVAPPIPDATSVIALDGANYILWGAASRAAGDFSHYKIYLDDAGTSLLLGETDSEGFLDLLAQNGSTYGYFVTAVDTDGHESDGSVIGEGTPRPDFSGELLYDFADVPANSGFLFSEDESVVPVVDGSDPADFDFRLEQDINGWWMVLGDNAAVYQDGFATTALKCGVGADATCVDVPVAPVSGYVTGDMQLLTETSYVLRVVGSDGELHFGIIRVTHLGTDQNGDDLMIFDWAYQLQANNPDLVIGSGG